MHELTCRVMSTSEGELRMTTTTTVTTVKMATSSLLAALEDSVHRLPLFWVMLSGALLTRGNSFSDSVSLSDTLHVVGVLEDISYTMR